MHRGGVRRGRQRQPEGDFPGGSGGCPGDEGRQDPGLHSQRLQHLLCGIAVPFRLLSPPVRSDFRSFQQRPGLLCQQGWHRLTHSRTSEGAGEGRDPNQRRRSGDHRHGLRPGCLSWAHRGNANPQAAATHREWTGWLSGEEVA